MIACVPLKTERFHDANLVVITRINASKLT